MSVAGAMHVWHIACFACVDCGKQLAVDQFKTNGGKLYCKEHFVERFWYENYFTSLIHLVTLILLLSLLMFFFRQSEMRRL